jgi:hypothetical protein
MSLWPGKRDSNNNAFFQIHPIIHTVDRLRIIFQIFPLIRENLSETGSGHCVLDLANRLMCPQPAILPFPKNYSRQVTCNGLRLGMP